MKARRYGSCCSILLLILLWSSLAFTQIEVAGEKRVLSTTKVEVEVVGDKKIRYEVALVAGEFFQVHVEQKNAEILLGFFNSGGNELARMSSPREKEGLETLSFLAAETGRYTLEVGLLDAQAQKGEFAIWRESSRRATSTDRRRVEVERLFAEGMKARDTEGQAEIALKRFTEALNGFRELNDEYMVQLSKLMVVRSQARVTFHEARKLLDEKRPYYEQALSKFKAAALLYKEGGQSFGEGGSLLGAALASQGIGDIESTIAFVESAIPLFSNDAERSVKANLLDILAAFYLRIDDIDTALKRLIESRSIYIQLQLSEDQARAENAIGALYVQIGRYEEAAKFFESSKNLRANKGEPCGLPATLTNLGIYYYSVNETAKASESLLDKALPLYPVGNECAGNKGETLMVIGQLYYDLGSNDLALKYLAEAVTSLKEESEKLRHRKPSEFDVQMYIADNKRNIATSLNYTAAAKFAIAKDQQASISLSKSNIEKAAEAHANVQRLYAEARVSYEEALNLYREIYDKKHEAVVMTNMGVVQAAAGETTEALKTFENALKVSRDAGDKDGEAITLNNIGETYSNLGEHRKALEFFNRALPLLKATGDRSGEAVALADAMYDWAQIGNPRMAIFCGKQAINIFQDLRRTARGLDTEIQKDYLRRIRPSYKRLAELLIAEGLYDQAVQILNLYQDQQFFDLDRKAPVDQAIFSPHEYHWVQVYERESKPLAQLNSRIEEGKRQRIASRLSVDGGTDQLQILDADLKRSSDVFIAKIEEAEKEFARPPDKRDSVAEIKPVTRMQNALRDLWTKSPRNKTVALYTLLGNDGFYVLLMTHGEIKAFARQVSADDLHKSIIKTLSDLKNPGFPEKIRASSANLYRLILGAVSTQDGKSTLDEELDKHLPDTLLWSLDGILSYLPVAALYDARKSQYLVEKYQNVVFTRADADRILRSRTSWNNAIGFGKSTGSKVTCELPCNRPPCDNKLKPLPLVPKELASIFRRTAQDRAFISGTVVLNEKFKRQRLLQAQNTPLVHIASHFCFHPGSAEASFLLLGDDTKFSLKEMSTHSGLYSGVDLLVLSACQTAVLERDQMGKEIDSLAEVSQRLGAASVIATLWNADEIGASQLMTRFYTLHKLRPELSKAELLRQAQLSLLKGTQTARDVNLDHPYYWAPFVLYGSFR